MTEHVSQQPHWNEDQLIRHLYDLEPDTGHLTGCDACRSRLSEMKAARREVETLSPEPDVDFQLLAAQRRAIYEKLPKQKGWQIRRWISVTATLLVLGGSALLFEQRSAVKPESPVSDSQLAAQVADMAEEPESAATAPLHALFEE